MKKSFYTAYTRVINRRTHYFVKRYDTFTDLKDIPPILDAMGMHTDFLVACKFAGVENDSIIRQLMEELNLTRSSGKVVSIELRKRGEERESPIWYPQYWLSKLKWAHI